MAAQIPCVIWYSTHIQSRHSLLCLDLNILWSIDNISTLQMPCESPTRLHISEKNSKRQCVNVQYRCFQKLFYDSRQLESTDVNLRILKVKIYIHKKRSRELLTVLKERICKGIIRPEIQIQEGSADLSFISKMN